MCAGAGSGIEYEGRFQAHQVETFQHAAAHFVLQHRIFIILTRDALEGAPYEPFIEPVEFRKFSHIKIR
jgi:hypothetical protein